MNKKIKALKNIFEELNVILEKKQKQKAKILIIFILIGALLETLGVSTLLPFIQGLISKEAFQKKWYVSIISSFFEIDNVNIMIMLMGGAIIFVYVLKNFYLIWLNKLQIKYRCNVLQNLSVRIFKSYMKRPYEFFVNMNSAEFIRGINDDVTAVFYVLDYIFTLIKYILTSAFIGVFIIYTDVVMAMGILAVAACCIIGYQFIFGDKLKKLRQLLRKANAKQYKSAYQAIGAIKDIKVMKRTDFFIKEYEEAYSEKNEADYGYGMIEVMPPRLIEMVCVSGLIIILCIRINMGVNTTEFVPKLATFAVAIFQIMPSISGIAQKLNGLSYKKASLDATYKNLIEVKEYELLKKKRKETRQKCLDVKFDDKIEIKNLEWKYLESNKIILNNVNLEIQKGESIAIIGESGSGKTTLINIILGLYDPQQGGVYVDGENINDISMQWSRMIGFVPQQVFLLDDTIRNNIIFGADYKSDEKIWQVLDDAQLKKFVLGLPDKLDTSVGEQGVRLSGGQRQRIAIARALYYDPSILILDEATSALDNETEKAVMDTMEKLAKKMTMIIVAHRLSTIKNCDRIYEVKQGRIEEKSREYIMRQIEKNNKV